MTTVEPTLDVGWVDEVLLAGPDDEVCLRLGAPVTRAALRRLVAERQARLESAGLGRGGGGGPRPPPPLGPPPNPLAPRPARAPAAPRDLPPTPHEAHRAL